MSYDPPPNVDGHPSAPPLVPEHTFRPRRPPPLTLDQSSARQRAREAPVAEARAQLAASSCPYCRGTGNHARMKACVCVRREAARRQAAIAAEAAAREEQKQTEAQT